MPKPSAMNSRTGRPIAKIEPALQLVDQALRTEFSSAGNCGAVSAISWMCSRAESSWPEIVAPSDSSGAFGFGAVPPRRPCSQARTSGLASKQSEGLSGLRGAGAESAAGVVCATTRAGDPRQQRMRERQPSPGWSHLAGIPMVKSRSLPARMARGSIRPIIGPSGVCTRNGTFAGAIAEQPNGPPPD